MHIFFQIAATETDALIYFVQESINTLVDERGVKSFVLRLIALGTSSGRFQGALTLQDQVQQLYQEVWWEIKLQHRGFMFQFIQDKLTMKRAGLQLMITDDLVLY